MRVLQIGGFMWGAQKTIEEGIHRKLVQMGHSSLVLFARGTSVLPAVLRFENGVENFLTRGLRKLFGKNAHFSILQTLRLIKLIHNYNPDIIHLHVLHSGCVDFSLLFTYLAKIGTPVVYTMHDMWAFTGGCYHYLTQKCTGYTNGCSNCPADAQRLDCMPKTVQKNYKKKRLLLSKLKDLTLVTVSEWVAKETKNSFLSEFPIEVIRNGIDFAGTEIREHPILSCISKPRKNIICVAASWTNSKGLDKLYSVAELLGEHYELLLIGSVSVQNQEKAPANVRFYGYCADKAMLLDLYRQSDLHVSASLEETFGMTFVEAAQAGLRSVGYSSSAISETLNLVHGICVKELSVEALYRTIVDVMEKEQNRLSENEMREIKEALSLERMSEEYVGLYERILS